MNLKKLELSLEQENELILEYESYVEDLLENEDVNKMKEFKHHHYTTCFDHSLNVSFYSFVIAKRLGLDYVSTARGGLLHDLFLYDWRSDEPREGKHAFAHPHIALRNAEKSFELNKIEKDIIVKHMWPVTIKLPKYKESFIVSCVDKYCATMEFSNGLAKKLRYQLM
ncbi:uncharacterized protein EDC19_1646 [Natranaerovirga hydrolytica]|uniref:HD domain-containing protein n=1 Tax=Natranaerovirga hydrolytica TaxID=680378 RepID=A0A4R1MTZ5_9FIRM|nr:HD domain-containing protein [Natranaerovirga hydrolytica]TCK93453.1 uncharacterized protein EDC19_1646 [Natranaerovirga hydrolytica]